MKTTVYHGSGSRATLALANIEKPIPADDEVLIKVRAAALNPIDLGLMKHPILRPILAALSKKKNTRPGRDVAGEIETVGTNVTEFKPGDAVFGLCVGAFAEYASASQSALVRKPDNASFEQAAAVPLAGLTALQGLRKANIQPGQKVLINGASGGVGTFALQIAKSFGAEVTGVCSTKNVEMVRSIGADHVVDYTRENFTKSGQQYDVFFDLVSNHPFSARRRVLKPAGIYVGGGVLAKPSLPGILAGMISDLVLSRFVSQKFVTLMAKISKEDLVILGELMETGKIVPVIDRCYSLSEAPEAIRYLEQRHARGKVVITFECNSSA